MEIQGINNFSSINSKNMSRMEMNAGKTGEFEKLLKSNIHKAREETEKSPKVKDEKLMGVCIEMESIFVGKMLKTMRETVHKSELINGGFAEQIFEDMLYDEYALNLSKNGNLGLASMLYDELSRL